MRSQRRPGSGGVGGAGNGEENRPQAAMADHVHEPIQDMGLRHVELSACREVNRRADSPPFFREGRRNLARSPIDFDEVVQGDGREFQQGPQEYPKGCP